MSHDTLVPNPSDPLDDIAKHESASFGISTEAGKMIAEHIGGPTHEKNAPLETLAAINQEVSVPTKKEFYTEDTSAVGMLPEDVSKFVSMGQSSKEGLHRGVVEVPSYVPELQRGDYKKTAEGLILRGMIPGADVEPYNQALAEIAPVTMLGAKDLNNKNTSSVQVVKYSDNRGMPRQVELIRTFDEDAVETDFLVRAA